jgi:diguanylate cyclase (GGDEF)-like protein/PAS domain S-box-containing protein
MDDQGAAASSAALRSLYELTTRVSGARHLDATLQAVVDAVVEAVGFGVAAINYVRPDGMFEIVAVAGSVEARDALLGTEAPPDTYDEEFARADHWGALRFVPHERLPEEISGWVPDVAVRDLPDAWHPLDALFAPLHAISGEVVGVLSVDLPADGRRPRTSQRELLEMFAAQAGVTIGNARLAEQLRVEHQRLQASEELFRLAFEAAGVGMAMVELTLDEPGRLVQVNEALARLTGHPVHVLSTMVWADLLHPDDRADERAVLHPALADVERRELRLAHADGRTVWVSATTAPVRTGASDAVHGFTQVEDVTSRKLAELELTAAARRDPLTGLLNRTALLEGLGSALDRSRRSGRAGAVLFCDLDGFKGVNDSLGHEDGDLVLMAVAERLGAQVRTVDTAARIGGDEFVVVVEEVDRDDLLQLVARIEQALAVPVTLRGRSLPPLTISIGIATLAPDSPDVETVLRQADEAMYAAKRAGRNRHSWFAG